MLMSPGKTCANCHKAIIDGDRVNIINTGTIGRVGGLGLMKDSLTFRGSERIEHVGERIFLPIDVTKTLLNAARNERDRIRQLYSLTDENDSMRSSFMIVINELTLTITVIEDQGVIL